MTFPSKRKKVAGTEVTKIAGIKISGDDLTRTDLMQIASEAEIKYNQGKYITNDKANAQSKNWGQSCGI